MLFLNPDYIGKGLGRQLIDFAFSNFDIRYVDVNEQNPKATEFYQKIGFEIFDRSEKDDLGKPYPILKMKLKK
jgi:putative acetyltransferase